MSPIDFSQLSLAASNFAIALTGGVISEFVAERLKPLLRAYPSPEQFYLDICQEFMELRWVKTLGDYDFDSLLAFISTEAASSQWAEYIKEGKVDEDIMRETFRLVGGNPIIFDALFDTFQTLIIRKLQSIMPEELRMLSVIVVSQGQELKRDIKELRDGLIRASIDKQTPPTAMALPTMTFNNYLANLKTRFHQRWNLFVYMLGKKVEDGTSASWTRQIFEPEIHMVLSEFCRKSSPGGHLIPVDIIRAVEQSYSLVLLGEPGSGKTTLLEKLAYEFASKAQANGGIINSIPIYINLGAVGVVEERRMRRKKQLFYQFLLREIEPYLPIALFEQLLHEGRIVFLLDGLNEMPRANYVRNCYEIRQFVEHFASNKFVIACREADYIDIFRTCEKLVILPLNEHQVAEFARSYLEKQKSEFLQELRESSSRFRELAKNPYMIMTMIAVFAYSGHLPDSRAQMLNIFIEALLEKAHLRGEVFNMKETYSLLAHLASFMANEGLLGSIVDVSWVRGKWLKKSNLSKRSSLDRLLDVASVAGILLVPHGRKTLQFSHQLLQEYLAMRVLCDKLFDGDDWRTAETRRQLREMSCLQQTKDLLLYHPKQVEILRLIASYVTPGQAIRLLKELVKTNIFLARAIGQELEPSVAQQVFKCWLGTAMNPSATFEEWQEAVQVLKLIEGTYAVEALITLSLNLSLMADVEPYLKQTVARAIKFIEMRSQEPRSLELT